MKRFYLLTALLCCNSLLGVVLSAQNTEKEIKTVIDEVVESKNPYKKLYLSTGIDGYILSTSFFESPLTLGKAEATIPRFTAFFHFNGILNFDFNKNLGLFSGLGIKNIGFIEKLSNPDSTIIRRVYTFGIPLGLKLGNLAKGNFIMLGGGVDFPFNYKEKGFVKRNDKEKFNQWFSTHTPSIMPYVFVGARLRPGLAAKLQYYPTNFLNENYEGSLNGLVVKPYQNYKVNLLLLTIGFDINYRPKY